MNSNQPFTAEAVNALHLNSDKDVSTGALHHTLGRGPTQASPGTHNHDGKNSKRIELKNLDGVSIHFSPGGGTTGVQPTFSGAPLFTGSYTRFGNICHFALTVTMTNITNFGTGQYYMTLPFTAEHSYIFRDGCLHVSSPSGIQFHIAGHILAGSNMLMLNSSDKVASGIQDVPFTSTVPTTLTTSGSFHIAGTYEIAVS